MKKVDRVQRLLKIVKLLQTGRDLEPDQLADSLKISRRTVFRDLKLLDDAGVGFRFSRRLQGYTPKQEPLLPPTHLTPGEALALLTLIRHGVGQRGLHSTQDAASAALKIEALLPRALRDYCGPLLAGTEFLPRSHPHGEGEAGNLYFLQRALAMRLKVRAVYPSASSPHPITMVLRPYRLVHVHRAWYLAAFSEYHGQTRLFKVERFARLQALSDTYRIDPAFSLERFLGRAWSLVREDRTRRIRIRFEPLVAAEVAEGRWHSTQRITWQPDGSLLFEAEVDGLQEIMWWILGYADQAWVLEPRELREMIQERVRRMAERYGVAGCAARRGA